MTSTSPGWTSSPATTGPARRWRSTTSSTLGHRRIAHIAGGAGRFAELRRDSYLAAMARHGLPPRVETSDATEEGGYRAAVRLLSGADRPTAVFAVNDVACIGAISAADELGLDLPH